MKLIFSVAFLFLFGVQIATAEAPLEVTYEKPKVLTIEEQVMAEIKKYDWNVDVAKKLFTHESGLNPKAENPEPHYRYKLDEKGKRLKDEKGNYIMEVACYGSFNVPQVACVNWKKGEDKTDFKRALAIANELYIGAGKSFKRDWPPCRRIEGCY